MSILNEVMLNKNITENKLSNIYLIYGNDNYLKEYYTNKISNMACTGDPFFNLQKFEGNVLLQEVYDAVKQYPMMADSKCVLLSDFDYQKADKSEFDKLCSLIKEVEEGCVLVISFIALDFDVKRDSKAKKLLGVVEKQNGIVVSLDHRDKYKLTKMLITGAQKRGCDLDSSDAGYIIETVGEDILILQNELNKLCAFVKSGKITRNIIDDVCVKSIDTTVYNYSRFIASGELSKALNTLDEMFFMRIEPLVILHTVASVYMDMYRVLACEKSGVPLNELAQDFDYKSKTFLIDKAKQNIRKFDEIKLRKSLELLLKTDKMLKSFSVDERQVLEKLTVELTSILWGE